MIRNFLARRQKNKKDDFNGIHVQDCMQNILKSTSIALATQVLLNKSREIY